MLRKTNISLLLVVIIGLGFSLTAFFYVKQWELQQAIDHEKRQADAYVRTLRQAFTGFSNILYSIESLYSVYGNVERQNFSLFVKRGIEANPGIRAFEWIPYIPATERFNFEEKTRTEAGFENFYLWEFASEGEQQIADNRSDYYPILFTEPHNENVGYDLGSDKQLRRALEKARDQGQLVASEAVYMEAKKSLGFRAFMPIYHQGIQHQTPEERQRHLMGFVSVVISFEDLIHTMLRLPRLRTEVFLHIHDATPGAAMAELYIPSWFSRDPRLRTYSEDIWSTQVEFAGRQWLVVLTKTPEGLAYQSGYAWAVLVVGLLFTIGLWRYLYLILNRAHWAEELVAKRTLNLLEEVEARKRVAEALEESRRRFQAVFDEAAMGIVQTDLTGKIIEANKAFEILFDYSAEELRNYPLNKLVHPDDVDIDRSMLEKMLAGLYDSFIVSKRYYDKYGNTIWTNQSCSIVRNALHPFIISMVEDVTERKCAEQARVEAEKKYRDIFENAIEGIFQCTPTGYFLSVNPAFVRIFGYESPKQMLAEVVNIGEQLYVNPQRRTEFLAELEKNSQVQNFEYEAFCRDGKTIWVNETARAVRDGSGKIRYYEGIVEDVTEHKRIETKLMYDASHDQLTGLLNRSAFALRLESALIRLRQLVHPSTFRLLPANDNHHSPTTLEYPFAVLFVDLDRFKIVNDSMGHLVGDQLLTEVAQRLVRETSQNDAVARLGGDEFALILENLPSLSILEQRVQFIQKQLNQPYLIEKETFTTTASIGIALASPTYTSADEVLRDADTAMYEAKKLGRNKAVIFQPGMHSNVLNLLRIETDLRKAIERSEFILYYQPIISLENSHTVGLEALVRWNHPEQGLIAPDKFIPIAEETGMIVEIGLWVLETACNQLRRWQIQFPQYADLGMNVNISPIQLKQPRLVHQIQDIIEKSGIHGTHCRLEITEGAMMHDPEAALLVLRELKYLEIMLYIDDFGTGYSSLSYLQKFPIDALKIDKSFIREIDAPGKTAQIAQAIIALGEAFNLRVVAEGVETDVQLSILKAAHCHHVQGYFFSRPRDSEGIETYLNCEIHSH